MPAYTKNTHNFTDGARAAAELTSGLKGGADAIAFVTCDAQVDYGALMGGVEKRLSCPVVGVTTLAFPLSETGDEVAARLVLFRRPGLRVSVASFGPFSPATAEAQMEALYNRCMAGFEGTPKLFILLLSPWDGSMDGRLINEVFRNANGVPVYGGVPSAEPDSDRAAVFLGGQCYHEGAVLIALGGDIKPIFAVGAQLTVSDEVTATVTQSEDAVVHRVNGIPFVQWMQQRGLAPADSADEQAFKDLLRYGPMHAMLRGKIADDDGIPELTGLIDIDLATGSGVFTAAVPVGTRVSLGKLERSDVLASANYCLDHLLYRMAESYRTGYEYQLLLAVSCVTRCLVQIGGEDHESGMLAQRIPPALSVATFYGFGEICPTGGVDGGAHNRTFGDALVMCAL